MNDFISIYEALKKIPKGQKINDPEKVIFICNLNKNSSNILNIRNTDIYFTLKSLKHIAEKDNDEFILNIEEICKNPDQIRRGRIKNRYLLVKYYINHSNRPCIVSIEVIENELIIVITIFWSDDKYLSNFDLLWRTGVS